MKADNPGNFFEFIDGVFSQGLPSNIANRPNTLEDGGRLLRKTRSAILQIDAQEKSELNITALLLPERYKLSIYYETLPPEMDEKQKALVIRWEVEEIMKNPDKFNPITKRTALNRSLSDNSLSCIILDCYPWLSKREIYTCIAILYSIWDSGDGYLHKIVPNLAQEYKPLFPTEGEAHTTIGRLVDKGIVRCETHFIEYADGLLEPARLFSLSVDVEIRAMAVLEWMTNEKNVYRDPSVDSQKPRINDNSKGVRDDEK
jgi:hypothetical protein